jgi:hypothetical protein
VLSPRYVRFRFFRRKGSRTTLFLHCLFPWFKKNQEKNEGRKLVLPWRNMHTLQWWMVSSAPKLARTINLPTTVNVVRTMTFWVRSYRVGNAKPSPRKTFTYLNAHDECTVFVTYLYTHEESSTKDSQQGSNDGGTHRCTVYVTYLYTHDACTVYVTYLCTHDVYSNEGS